MSIRLRLALWYTALAGVVLAAVLLAAFFSHSAALATEVDSQLQGVAGRVAARLERDLATQSGITPPDLQPISNFTDAEIWVRYVDETGRVEAESPNATGRPLLFSPLPAGVDSAFDEERAGRERLRGFVERVRQGDRTAGYVLAATSLASVDQLNLRFALLLIAISVGGLLLTATAGWAIAAGALRPISAIIAAAQAIRQARSFDQRLPEPPRPDELRQLTRTLNEMLAALEAAYAVQRRFVDDAAHELRAPITIIQGNLALLRDPSLLPPEERRQVLADFESEVQRLGRLVNGLLVLARADAGQVGRQEIVQLDAVLTAVYQRLHALGPPVKLTVQSLAPVCVRGDVDRLQQLVLALVENAVDYTPAGGEVALALASRDGEALLTVSDTGIGILPGDLPHIFERFYRGDAARDLRHEGTGLGLPIARWIAEAHGGALDVETRPGEGSVCTVRLPAVPCRPGAADSHS